MAVLERLEEFFIDQVLFTVNRREAFKTYRLIVSIATEYKFNTNPLIAELRNIDVLSSVFVVVVNLYTDADEGTQKVFIDVAVDSLDNANDGKVAAAFVAAIAINFNCNQLAVINAGATADEFAAASGLIDIECSFDTTVEDFVT